ncbi:uncharacterized protein LOC117638926 isoform X2 [Thrips palmi]|uniref:Uncharacterized protein LOC117638926 isoform X2 n=1 Tax=Thrips palmi TaxID=161013 RepID=A0A6P8Y1E6_THRPL|nr:uncharacterized protein LOC117638926 isoform X2 [Thrips palmi]
MSIVPMPQQDIELSNSPSAGTPSSKAEKNKHIVIIYANCKETTRKLIGKLIKGFESTLKDCTVSDYTKIGSLLERDIHWLYTGNTFDKAMVLLSPEVSSLLQCNAENIAHDFYSRFVYHFFTKYLLDPHSKDKIIFISFEKEPCLDLNFCSFSTVYALPTKLRDLLQLFDLKGDDSVIKEFESNLR